MRKAMAVKGMGYGKAIRGRGSWDLNVRDLQKNLLERLAFQLLTACFNEEYFEKGNDFAPANMARLSRAPHC